MMTRALGTPPSSVVVELARLAEPHRDRLLIAAVVAFAAHAGLGLYAAGREPTAAVPPPPVEVELAFREPPPPAPEPLKEPEPPKPEPPPKAEAPRLIAKLAPPPPAARAGAVLTALPDPTPAPTAAEPFDFTSDPNSHVYGSGVVAVGGTATHGLAGARVGGTGTAPVRPVAGDGLTAASDLSQKPRLREADPCRGFFPDTARDDVAVVSVRVVIGKSGGVSNASVVSESPAGQGFGAAARRCMLDQVFLPALDKSGNSAATALNVNVKFSR
jgi:outer membrane biosynthesis protein TonB